MKQRLAGTSEQMTYEELYANVRAGGSPPGAAFDFEIALRYYLTPQRLPNISNAALARVSSDFEGSRGGHPRTIVTIVHGEQVRRHASNSVHLDARLATAANAG